MAHVQNRPVDVVVLDMIMDPGMGGRETYERLLQLRPGQRAVIASGYSLTDDVRRAQELGAGEYVKKPYTLEDLGLALRHELAKR